MSKNAIAAVWRWTPAFVRRFLIRSAQSRFTISAGAVVVREDGRVLVLEHRFRPGAFSLGIPGGFISHCEQPDVALRRELKEETGLELTAVELLCTRTIGNHFEVVYVARASGTVTVAEWEIAAAEWYDPAHLPDGLHQGQRDLIERGVRLVGSSSI